jgi:hypothetical protein
VIAFTDDTTGTKRPPITLADDTTGTKRPPLDSLTA